MKILVTYILINLAFNIYSKLFLDIGKRPEMVRESKQHISKQHIYFKNKTQIVMHFLIHQNTSDAKMMIKIIKM